MPVPIDSYAQAIEFLYGRIDFERSTARRSAARHLKLDRMQRLLELLGNPHERIPAIHIAGTKGKGSTAVMAARILSAAGLRTGLFTSPHVSRFEERIQLDGEPPDAVRVVDLVRRVADAEARIDTSALTAPSFFEVVTAMAWLDFVDRGAEVAVLEVGLGGRLDATNLCRPEVTVITNISLDHTAILGSTPDRIAREKAGIIKRDVPVVCGVEHPAALAVVEQTANRLNAPLLQLGREVTCNYRPPGDGFSLPATVDVNTPWRTHTRLPLPLRGGHQAANAALAVAAVDWLGERGFAISETAVRRGLAGVRWPIRMELVRSQPLVLLDAAHNAASVDALVNAIRAELTARRRVLIFAATSDKDTAGLLTRLLPQFDTTILTQYTNNPRAVAVEKLKDTAARLGYANCRVAAEPRGAWQLASSLANPADLICVTGSFFLASEMRELLVTGGDAGAG